MSIVFTKSPFKNKKLLFAIVDQANVQFKHKELFQKIFDITFSYTTRLAYPMNKEVKSFKTIDEVMQESEDYDLIIIQSVGNFIKDNRLLVYLEEYVSQNPDFFIVAFTLDWNSEKKRDWIEIHHQMLVISTSTWIDLGKPKFGNWYNHQTECPNYIRSKENFHDNYTPFWIEGATGTSMQPSVSQGWQFLSAALSQGIKIDNFTKEMRDCRLYVYPESNTQELFNAFKYKDSSGVTNPNQKKWISSLRPKPTIWIFNSEKYQFPIDLSKCDTYFGPAAGFKYLDALNSNPKIKFVFYDNSEISLEWIKNIKENWDGHNLLNFLKNQDSKFQSCYKYIDSSLEKNEQILYQDFKGKENFLKLWNIFKKSDVEYIQANLYDIEQVKTMLSSTRCRIPLIYYSNIFATDYTIVNYSLEEVKSYHSLFLETVKNEFTDSIVYGADPFGSWLIS